MNIEEIRSSGLLEYYVLGLLSKAEMQEVESYLVQFPELKQDFLSIQNAMQYYAQSHGIAPKDSLKPKVFDTIKSKGVKMSENASTNVSGGSKKSSILPLLLCGLVTVGALAYAWGKIDSYNKLDADYQALRVECDSLNNVQTKRIKTIDKLSERNNRATYFAATDNYKETKLIFHHNIDTKENFIQIQNLPEIPDGMAFQLWSLKEGLDPIPLTVFNTNDGNIVPVDFEDGTGTYAITIEKAGGVQSPTLTRLIGTVGV